MTAPMPQPTQSQIDSYTKLAGEAAIYLNCTKPADLADVALTAGVPAGGTWVGTTTNAAEWIYKPTVTGIKIEQTNLEVAPRITNEQINLTFTCAEAVAEKISLAVTGGTLVNTTGSGLTPGKKTVSMGGSGTVTPQCIVLVSSIGNYVYMATTVQLYEWFVIYNAVSMDGTKLSYLRNGTRMVAVNIQGFADATRTVGDHLAKYGSQYDPN